MVGTLRDPSRPVDEELKVGTRKRPAGAGEMAPPAAMGSDPARAASMQAQMSQPVYKGEAGVKETQRQADLQRGRDFSDAIQHEADRAVASAQDGQFAKTGPRPTSAAEPQQLGTRKAERSGWSNAVDGLAGGAKAVAGAALVPHAAAADAVRNAAAMVAGGDPDTLDGGSAKYRDKAFGTFNEGLSQASGAAQNIKADVRDVLGVKPLPSQAQAPVADSQGQAAAPSAPSAPTAATQGDSSEGQAASQVAATGGSEWQGTGIGRDQAGGEIAMRIGAGGVPEFTNENATPGATTGAAPAQEGFGSRRPAASSVGDGVGTFTQLEPGSAKLAIERFGRANEIRAGTQRPRELGDNGGRLTVVRDSSRAPTMADLQNAKLDARQAQTADIRERTAQSSQQQQRESINSAVDRQLRSFEAAQAQLGLADRQRLSELQQSILDPSISTEQRRALAEQYRVLSGEKSENRFTVVPGGQEYDATAGAMVNRPARVLNNQTGEFVEPGQIDQQAAAPASNFEAGKVYTDAQGRRARWDGSKFVPV
ncbi:hypothetical protein [Aquipseudomonas alcaligenes]|uniref:hypothetical protein n=1 Tax=Aquipseudomonas alcaligenes TaxID=43263 RepID=UPI00364C0210